MPERGVQHREPERADRSDDGGYDAGEQLRRALAQQHHAERARRFFEEAPLYCIQFENDGTVSLRRKCYNYWPARPPADATLWRVLSTHRDLEDAERRLRRIASPPVHYDERGRLAQAPRPDEGEQRSQALR